MTQQLGQTLQQEKNSLANFLKNTMETLPGFPQLLQTNLANLLPKKRPPGRPRIHPKPDPNQPKRPPGRPRIHPKPDPNQPKRPPGRPRIHPKPDPNQPKRKPGRPKKVLANPTELPIQTQEKEPAIWQDSYCPWTEFLPEELPTEDQQDNWILWDPQQPDPWEKNEETQEKTIWDEEGVEEIELTQLMNLFLPFKENPDQEDLNFIIPDDFQDEPISKKEEDEETPEEEKQSPKDSIDLYYQEIRSNEPLTLELEIELGTKYREQGCMISFNRMVEANLKLVVHIAKRFRGMLRMFPSSMCFSDLISEGNIGLIKAIERYDPKMGNKISTYASWWITQQIQAAIQKQGKLIRIPTHLLQKMKKIQRILDEYQKEHHKKLDLEGELPPDLLQILKSSGIKPSVITALKELLNLSAPSISLDDPAFLSKNQGEGSSEQSLHEVIEDEKATCPYEAMATLGENDYLAEILSELTPKEKKIIEERFGLITHDPKTLKEVGEIYGITRERVRQIQEKALKKMRTKILEKRKFEEITKRNQK